MIPWCSIKQSKDNFSEDGRDAASKVDAAHDRRMLDGWTLIVSKNPLQYWVKAMGNTSIENDPVIVKRSDVV